MKEYIFKQYLDNVIEHLGITLEDLLQETKTRTIVEARYILYYLCQERGMSLSEIKSYMETQGFEVTIATMMKGVAKAKDIIDNDSDYKYIVRKLQDIEL